MRTIYSNTRHPKFVKWSVIAAAIISVSCLILYIVVDDNSPVRPFLYFGWLAFLYAPLLGGQYLLSRYVIDEEADTHDKGVGFMDIRTSKENADRITAQLTKANPSIVVNHVNYL